MTWASVEIADLVRPLAGGSLIGVSLVMLFVLHGRIAGISGLAANTVSGTAAWYADPLFVAGMIAGGLLYGHRGGATELSATAPVALLVVAGFLVGFGARIGNGCTSGHGVCGVGRGARRSIIATLIFVATGAAAVAVRGMV